MNDERWHDVGEVAELSRQPLQELLVGRTKTAAEQSDAVRPRDLQFSG